MTEELLKAALMKSSWLREDKTITFTQLRCRILHKSTIRESVIKKTTAKARTLAVVFYLRGYYLTIYVISLRPIDIVHITLALLVISDRLYHYYILHKSSHFYQYVHGNRAFCPNFSLLHHRHPYFQSPRFSQGFRH